MKKPPLQMMPSLKQKQAAAIALKARKAKPIWIPRGLILEIGILMCAKVKSALAYMQVCKVFREVC